MKKSCLFIAILCVQALLFAGCKKTDSTRSSQQSVAQEITEPKRDVYAKNGVVSAANPLASQIGLDVLKSGGNAFDAAVATAFAINVAEPNASGIGGGGFAILYSAKDKKSYVIDFRETAPAKAHENFYKLDESGKVIGNIKVTGWYAAAVPGQVAGIEELHKRFGTKKWEDLVNPAIQLLEDGIPINDNLYNVVLDELTRASSAPSKDFFEKTFFNDGLPLAPGEKYYNNDLKESLKLIAKDGAKAFYKGSIADKIHNTYKKEAGGWITKEDLASYKVIIRDPIEGTYRDKYKVLAVPPPSSGGLTVIEIGNILEHFNLKKMGYASADAVHATIEAHKLAFADRNTYIGDPAFVNVPSTELLSKEFAAQRAELINMQKAMPAAVPGQILKDMKGSTTSFSIIDKDGNMITITQTINYFFGSIAVPDGTGIFMNNEMDDFNAKPGTANSVEAGKRPLSSMAPVLVFKDGEPFMTLGSPGGARIITAVFNVISNVIDFDMDLQAAIEAPRFHNPNTEKTAIESRWSENLREELIKRGQVFDVRPAAAPYFGGAQGVMILPDKSLHAAADIRRAAKALGY